MKTIHTYNQEANGLNYSITSGDFVTVSLPENPSTGYHWVDASPFQTSADKSEIIVGILKLLGASYTPSQSNLMGKGGIKVLAYGSWSAGMGEVKINKVGPDGEVVDTIIISFMLTS
ncbi:MAG: protease inhibitor I42 family protein [Bacteroidota bacterium]